MFRAMRRSPQQLSDAETIAIMERATTGVLALLGDDGYPYAVPLNYLYRDGTIIFHGAKAGHKLDAITAYDKASFCVIDYDEIIPEKVTDYFRSVIAFGRVRQLEEGAEKRQAAYDLGMKFSPEDAVLDDMARSYNNVVMYVMHIEHMTGKESLYLIHERNSGKE